MKLAKLKFYIKYREFYHKIKFEGELFYLLPANEFIWLQLIDYY